MRGGVYFFVQREMRRQVTRHSQMPWARALSEVTRAWLQDQGQPGTLAVAKAAVQLLAPLAAVEVSQIWVVSVASVERGRYLPVLSSHPLGLLPPPVGRAAGHLHWSKLPSVVLAWSAARDASSLCHNP